MLRLLAALALLLLTPAAGAQTLADAEAAYAEGRYAEAAAAAQRAAEADPQDAEAQYLLGRVLFEPANPARDERAAGRAIDRAIALAPQNVLYLVARLETLRVDTWSFLLDLVRTRQRAELADRILAIDPDNAFAHEELGVQAIRDYYQYRNAIAFPTLSFFDRSASLSAAADDEASPGRTGATAGQGLGAGRDALDAQGAGADRARDPLAFSDPDRFAVVDRELGEGGAPSLSYRARADAAYARAVGHLRAALAADPRRRSVYDHALRLTVLSDDFEDAIPTVREMLVQFETDPAAWLYAGLVAHRTGQFDAAEASFRQALARMPDADSTAFDDLTLILPPQEWDAFRAEPATFARRYWTARDPRFLNAANERRSEHYARLTEAALLFRSDDLGIPGWQTERGRLYVRYGPPDADVIIDGTFGRVLESFPDRDPRFAPDAFTDVNRFAVWDYGAFRLVFEDPNRNGEFRLYSPPADVYSLASATALRSLDYVTQTRERVRETPERYSFRPAGRAVDLPYRVVAFKGEAGEADLVVAFGVPIAGTGAPDPAAPDVDLTLRTGTFLVNALHDVLFERRRTVYGLRAAQIVGFDRTRLWTSAEVLRARPGPHEVSVEFETASGGTSGTQRRDVDVPDYAAAGLTLSDLMLAYHIDDEGQPAPGRVVRNGYAIQPAPWAVFGVADPVYLYAEVYGLGVRDGQTDYEVEARLVPKDTSRGLGRVARRLFGGRDRGVSTAVESAGSGSDDWLNLIVDAAGQEPGLYTLTVTVRDRIAGRQTQRSTDLFLED